MATVFGQVAGGEIVNVNAKTVGDVREELGLEDNYQAQVNAKNAEDSHSLNERDFVTFTVKVKGA